MFLIFRSTFFYAGLIAALMAGFSRNGLAAEKPAAGIDAFLNMENLPLLRDGVQTLQFSAYDRSGDNYDSEYFPLYTEENGECVIFDAFGPGCLYRQHMNLWGPMSYRDSIWVGVNIRYYFDNEKLPRIDMDVSTFFSVNNPFGFFRSPLAVDGGDRFRLLYCPMPFKKRLKVTLSREPGGEASGPKPWEGHYSKLPQRRSHWYQYTCHLFRDDFGLKSWTQNQDLSSVVALWQENRMGQDPKPAKGRRDNHVSGSLAPGKTLVLTDLAEPGSIAGIRINIAPLSEETLFNTCLRMFWDGKSSPQVEVPLGCFFGAYRTALQSRFSSLLLGYSPESMYCYLPMPFWKTARIELENRGASNLTKIESQISFTPAAFQNYPQDNSGYFHAQYHHESPRTEGHDYNYLDFEGAGHVVGHTVARWETSMEENERTYFDYSGTPQIKGNGFEDDHNMGWGLANRQHAVFGAIGAREGSGAIYRFFIPDLYCFSQHVRQGHQVYGPNSPRGHEGMYHVGNEESVAFFYAVDQPRLVQTDKLDIGNAASESGHEYKVAGERQDRHGEYWYDGEFNNVLFKTPATADNGVAFKKSCEFRVKIDPVNNGIRLRRRTDKENNRQLANVFIDGRLVEERPWYTVDHEKTYRNIRWLDTDFDVPQKYTLGKDSVRVKIEFVSSETGEWEEFYYWIFSFLK